MNWFYKLKNKYRILIAVASWLPLIIVAGIMGSITSDADEVGTIWSIIILFLLALAVVFTIFTILAYSKDKKIVKQAKQKEITEQEAQKQQEKQAKIDEYNSYFHFEYNVVGTSFENTDGTSRQKILSNIINHKPPFHISITPSLKIYDFEGQSAVGVYINDVMIGNIGKEDKQFILDHFDNIIIENFLADEFYSKKDSKTIYYAKITIKAKKDN